MRSPNTVENLKTQSEVEINFVDVLSRKGVRIRGKAIVVDTDSEEFNALLPHFQPIWGDLCDAFNRIIKIPCESVKPLQSPAYEYGGNETELRALWKQKIEAME